MTLAPDEDSTCLRTPIKRGDRKLRIKYGKHKSHKWKGKMPLHLHEVKMARCIGESGADVSKSPTDTRQGKLQSTERSGRNTSEVNISPKKRKKETNEGCQPCGSKIKLYTSKDKDQPEKLFKMDHLDGSTLSKKAKKGTNGGFQAAASKIKSDTSKDEDQPEKLFGRDLLDWSTLSKKPKKGREHILQKSSTRRKIKKLPVVQKQYLVRKCKGKDKSRLKESKRVCHNGTNVGCQAGGSKTKSDTSKDEDQPEKLFGRDLLDGSTLSKKPQKGRENILQKSSTRRKIKKLPVLQRQYLVRKCKGKDKSQLQESKRSSHNGKKNILQKSSTTRKTKQLPLVQKQHFVCKRKRKVHSRLQQSKAVRNYGTTSKYNALESKLQLAIQALNQDMCKSLLINLPEIELLQVLSSAFQKALITEKNEIKKVVFSQIVKFSPDIIKKFRASNNIPENINIWMATECTCDKRNIKTYKDLPCFNTLPVIVVEMNESRAKFYKTGKFFGFPIRIINLTTEKSEDNEAKTVFKKAVGKSNGCIANHKIHASIGKHFFQRHSNLTMICPSKWKSTGFNQKRKHEVEKIDCVNLFCKIKGIVPIGEHHFPQKIQGFQTDVLNGRSYLTATLKIGDNMQSVTGTGTLGGFVKYYGTDTFLTCAHVIFGKDNLLDLQKDNIHFVCRKMTNEGSEPVECTLIRHALNCDTVTATEIDKLEIEEPIESQSTNAPETSVDAALLLIQTPSDTSNTMVNLKLVLKDNVSSTKRNLKRMGIKSIYLNENKLPNPAVIQSKAVALSAITGEQRKDIKVKQVKELFIRYSTHARLSNNITVYNQLTIENMDFQSGDSGTCIYAICPRKEDSGCIGMLIGKSTSGQFVVTPIDEILKALGVH